MRDVAGKSAFVTGGANGIGLGIARALASAGANVVIADIEQSALEVAKSDLDSHGTEILAMTLDVSDRAAVEQAARDAQSALGNIHILVNNAGVSLGPFNVTDIESAQWDWLFGVNVYGVIHGVSAFVPGMLAHGEEAHVVSTASIGGLQVHPELRNGSYAMTKYAVVALSEALELQLQGSNIGVSVLCPAAVRTTLGASPTRRPERFGGPFETPIPAESRAINLQPEVLDPDDIGARVLDAIGNAEFFIFTHSDPRGWIERRNARLVEAFDLIDRYKARVGLP